MASDLGRIILIDLDEEETSERRPPIRFAAFVPMALALLGIGAILAGGITAGTATVADRQMVDPIATGSITPAE
jgi:hypothetical protein